MTWMQGLIIWELLRIFHIQGTAVCLFFLYLFIFQALLLKLCSLQQSSVNLVSLLSLKETQKIICNYVHWPASTGKTECTTTGFNFCYWKLFPFKQKSPPSTFSGLHTGLPLYNFISPGEREITLGYCLAILESGLYYALRQKFEDRAAESRKLSNTAVSIWISHLFLLYQNCGFHIIFPISVFVFFFFFLTGTAHEWNLFHFLSRKAFTFYSTTVSLVSFADVLHHSLTLSQMLWITICDNFSKTQQYG